MRFLLISILFILVFMVRSHAQEPFSQTNVGLPQLEYSACAWGDFDNDGDLDLALTGLDGNNLLTKIYGNKNGNFTDIGANLLPLHFGSVEWGDYDTDGDLDLLSTGIDILGNPFTRIYKNNSGTFTDTGINLPGVNDGQATWGDYDNDGDLDILIVGSLVTSIFRNDGNDQFVNINAPLTPVQSAMGCWVDYNNDGQPDAMVSGDTGGGMITRLYKNNHGEFTEVNISPSPFLGLFGGQVKWADLDNDGDQDLAITGTDEYIDGYFIIYRNDGNDHFTKLDEYGANLLTSSLDIGDFNADGLPDIVLMGRIPGCGGSAVTILLQNLGSMNFSEVSMQIPGFKQGGVTWGDYNNDGYSDLLFTGFDNLGAPKTELYLNNLGNTSVFISNTPPSPPQGLNVAMESDKASLHWNSSSDAQTPKDALSYNISIGTLPGLFDVFSPMAMPNSGFRMVATPGNTSADTSWTISDIPAGTYYFSVQAIDNGFMPGEFSEPYMFNFAPVGMAGKNTPEPLIISPNPFTDNIQLNGKNSFGAHIQVYNSKGQTVYESQYNGPINTNGWQKGIYMIRILNEEGSLTSKALKN